MVYNYPQLSWRLDSVLLGRATQTVPFIMYPSAHFYFVTYHTIGVIVLRRAADVRALGHAWLWPSRGRGGVRLRVGETFA
jgi:hypothetical protein